MIKFKPSSRLPVVNEENFTSDPTSRGWIITGTGASINGGLRCTGNNTAKTAIATCSGPPLTKYISFTFSGDSGTGNSINIGITIKQNGTTLFTNSGNIGYSGSTGIFGNFSIYKSKKGAWIAHLTKGYAYANYSNVITSYLTNNLDSGLLTIELSMYVNNNNSGYITLTNLKWV